ncbi:MAG: YhbY family RNA-binding protein [Eubacteriales bacterium]|nr:YhbY family RNA-binding protein [Eubacteriales bacterium]
MTGKQRAYLRKLANKTDTNYQIGKDGLDSENFIALINDALEANELIKIHVLENSGYTAKSAIDLLCEYTGAEPVQAIGRRIIIYKKSAKKPKIELPL